MILISCELFFFKLLDFEPRAERQVPLLISMKQEQLALTKAIESGDTDLSKFLSLLFQMEENHFSFINYLFLYILVYLVLLHVNRNAPEKDFYEMIARHNEAVNLYIAYCKEQDASQLLSVYEKTRLYNEALNMKLMMAFDNKVWLSNLFAKVSFEEFFHCFVFCLVFLECCRAN
jgi:vacuolar protein sorting-associated protein 16